MDSNSLIIDSILASTTNAVRNSTISNESRNSSKFHVDMEDYNEFRSVRETDDKQSSSNEIYNDKSNQSDIDSESTIEKSDNSNSSDRSPNRLKSQESDNNTEKLREASKRENENSSEVCIKEGEIKKEDEQANDKINLHNIETYIVGGELAKELIGRDKININEENIDVELLKDLKLNISSVENSILLNNKDANNSVLQDIKTIGDNSEANKNGNQGNVLSSAIEIGGAIKYTSQKQVQAGEVISANKSITIDSGKDTVFTVDDTISKMQFTGTTENNDSSQIHNGTNDTKNVFGSEFLLKAGISKPLSENIQANNFSLDDFANTVQKISDPAILSLENDKSKNASMENKSGFDITQIQTGSDSYVAENYTLENTKDINLVQNGSANDVTTVDIGKQVFESIQNHISQQSDEKQITVRLNPPELGQVCIKFQEQDNEITGLLEVSKTQTRVEIEQALPQIIRDLNHSGIDIKRLEVVLTGGDHQHDAAKDGSMFYDGSQNQNFSDSDSQERHNNSLGYNEWLTKNIEYQNNSTMQELFTAQNSINMLV